MTIQCPKCDSDNVQSVKAILEGGTTRSTGHYSGYVAGAGTSGTVGGGYASGTTYNTSKTDLAQSLENYIFGGKPEKPRFGWILRGIILIAGSNFLLGFGGYLHAILNSLVHAQYGVFFNPLLLAPLLIFWWLWFKKAKSYAKKVKGYKLQLADWERSTAKGYNSVYYCHKCGNRFTPGGFSEHELWSKKVVKEEAEDFQPTFG